MYKNEVQELPGLHEFQKFIISQNKDLINYKYIYMMFDR